MLLTFLFLTLFVTCTIATEPDLHVEVHALQQATAILTKIHTCPSFDRSSRPLLERLVRLYDVVYFCPTHYRLEGPVFRECRKGQWHPPEEPRCIRICPEGIAKPQYLHMEIATDLMNLWVRCVLSNTRPASDPDQNSCHEYETKAELYQKEKLPGCNISCQISRAPKNGKLILRQNETHLEELTAEIECSVGFDLVPPEPKVRQCFNGSWTGTQPNCRRSVSSEDRLNVSFSTQDQLHPWLYWMVFGFLVVCISSFMLVQACMYYQCCCIFNPRISWLKPSVSELPLRIHLEALDNTDE